MGPAGVIRSKRLRTTTSDKDQALISAVAALVLPTLLVVRYIRLTVSEGYIFGQILRKAPPSP